MHEQIEAYQAISLEIADQVVSSYDLFPSRGLYPSAANFVSLSMHLSRLGLMRFNLLVNYFGHYYKIIKSIYECIQKNNYQHAMQLASLVMYQLGIGESDVLSHMVYLQLLQCYPELNFAIIALANEQNDKHFLVLIAPELPEPDQDFATYAAYHSEAVIIDSFLNYLGPASQFYALQHDFLAHHNFQHVKKVIPKEHLTSKELSDLDHNAQQIHQMLQTNMQLNNKLLNPSPPTDNTYLTPNLFSNPKKNQIIAAINAHKN